MLGWTAPPPRPPQPTAMVITEELLSGPRTNLLASVDRGKDFLPPPPPSSDTEALCQIPPVPPPFVVSGKRRLYSPDLGILTMLRMKLGIQKCPQVPEKNPHPTLSGPAWGFGQGCIRRGRASEAVPEAVRQAVGEGCQSGCGRLLSVTNATEAGTCRQGDSGRV